MSQDFGETTVNHYHGLGLILQPLGVNSDARISTPPNFPMDILKLIKILHFTSCFYLL